MATGPVVAQELTIDWSRTAATGGVVLPGAGPDGTAALQLRAAGPTSFHLVTIERPPVTDPTYAVTGQVRYQGVEGQGYLEMWTVFPDGGGIIGALGGRGKARRLVLTLLVGMIAAGGCLVLIAVAAASTSQPRHVWYPLLVIGGASAVIALVILPAMRRRYAADELRRI